MIQIAGVCEEAQLLGVQRGAVLNMPMLNGRFKFELSAAWQAMRLFGAFGCCMHDCASTGKGWLCKAPPARIIPACHRFNTRNVLNFRFDHRADCWLAVGACLGKRGLGVGDTTPSR